MSAVEQYDIIVIGGGINGAGVARDAARRGLTVLLLERDDFGSGTSSWSSRLIHGGLRYLEYAEIGLVYESLRDRRALLRTAPHLVEPLRLTIPIYRGGKRGKWVIRAGLLAYDVLSWGKKLPTHSMANAERTLAQMPGLNTEGLVGSASYSDAQVVFAERLVIENILDAQDHGARCINYAGVTELQRRDNAITGVTYFDERLGQAVQAHGNCVINAAGPWVDHVLRGLDSAQLPDIMGGTKGSHIVVAPFTGFGGAALYTEARADGRPFFILPWNDQVLIGTTDIRDDNDPSDLVATQEEIDYLLTEVNQLFPDAELTSEQVRHSYSGMRPLPRQTDGPESAISRAHEIRHHADTARGLYSVIGGKLTTYRSLALDVLQKLNRDQRLRLAKSDTDTALLPGAKDMAEARRLCEQTGWLDDADRARLLRVYGGMATAIVSTATDTESLLRAEVEHVIEQESAHRLEDILCRRTMLGLGPRRGVDIAHTVASLAGERLGWSERQAREAGDRYVDMVNRRFRHALKPLTPS